MTEKIEIDGMEKDNTKDRKKELSDKVRKTDIMKDIKRKIERERGETNLEREV